jgi:hypothetical protein
MLNHDLLLERAARVAHVVVQSIEEIALLD